MRRRVSLSIVISAILMLGACQSEPDFDTRFETKEQALKAKGQAIESSVNAQLRAAHEAQAARGEAVLETPDATSSDTVSRLEDSPENPSFVQ